MHFHRSVNARLPYFACLLLICCESRSAPPDRALIAPAEGCEVTVLHGSYARLETSRGSVIRLATDENGNPSHAVGDFMVRIPDAIPDGSYRLTVEWKTGNMDGKPWAYQLGTSSGSLFEKGVLSGQWHYFYPGRDADESDQWYSHDLAGPEPVQFAMWPNSPVAESITTAGVERGGLYVRIRDMSPSQRNALSIKSLKLTPIEHKPLPATDVMPGPQLHQPVGEDFTIGAYYAMPWLQPKDEFSWDYAFMDMARLGCNFVVISGNCWADQWAAIKHWDMRGVTSYGELNAYPGPGKWKPEDFVKGIQEKHDFFKTCIWKGEHVGDTCIGHIMTDEPECPPGLSEDKKAFLRAWADTYHRTNPGRKVYVNHCDPPWYDLHEKHATCSAAPTIAVNSPRISARIEASRSIGDENFTVVALLGRLTDWAGGSENNLNYWGMQPATPEVFAWLAGRSHASDAYEQMVTAYCYGARGFHPYMYNQHRAVSLVDRFGNGQYGIREGFRAAAHDLRRAHGWPAVTLLNNGSAFNDRGKYVAGPFKLSAHAASDSAGIAKVVFGKSSDGGSTWVSQEDLEEPYTATFDAEAGETVIFRARAMAKNGKTSIYAANMIHVVEADP